MTDAFVPTVDPVSITPTSTGGTTAEGLVVVETAVVSVVPVASGALAAADPATGSPQFSLDAPMVTGATLAEPSASGLQTTHTPPPPTPPAVPAAFDGTAQNPARPDPSGSTRDAIGAGADPPVVDQRSAEQRVTDQRGAEQRVTAKAIGPAPPIDAGDVLVAAADLVIGTAWWVTGPIRAVGRLGVHAVQAGLAGATARSRRLQLRAQARRGDARSTLDLLIQAVLRPIIKRVVDAALAELDLTKIVLEHVDLDRVAEALDIDGIVAGVDLDAAVARVDLDAAVGRVDLDQIVDRIDVDGIVASVDIGAVVDRVDIESIVNRLDIDGIVAEVNLQAIVDRLDIAAVVAKVDPDPVVSRVNFDAAMSHIDLIGIAQRVVDGIDLPGIIRESTGSLATEAVAGVRVQGQAADDAVGQLVGRVLRRRALDPPRSQ